MDLSMMDIFALENTNKVVKIPAKVILVALCGGFCQIMKLYRYLLRLVCNVTKVSKFNFRANLRCFLIFYRLAWLALDMAVLVLDILECTLECLTTSIGSWIQWLKNLNNFCKRKNSKLYLLTS